MVLQAVKKLTFDIFMKCAGRFIINVRTPEVFVADMPHPDAYCLLLNLQTWDQVKIKENPEIAGHLIPLTLEMNWNTNPPSIAGMEIGTSYLEMNVGVRHTKQDMETAQKIALELVSTAEIPCILENLKILVATRFIK